MMSAWLDTETKSIMRHEPPERDAPSDTGTFTLVIIRGIEVSNVARVARVLRRIPGVLPARVAQLTLAPCEPIVRCLSLSDAMLWQFELICCDVVSVFLRDEIIAASQESYLQQLYSQLAASPEFDAVRITVTAIPKTMTASALSGNSSAMKTVYNTSRTEHAIRIVVMSCEKRPEL